MLNNTKMQEYFVLQIKMLNRKIIAFGIPLLLAYLLFPVIFFFLSNYLFSKTTYAIYFYGLASLGFTSTLSELKKNDFLRSIFNKTNYYKVRAAENLASTLPFLVFMLSKRYFPFAIILLLLSMLLIFSNFLNISNFKIPSPFSKRPFEFTIGFRKTYYLFAIAYFLAYMATSVGNFNLGIFSMILIGLICASYYLKPENEYIVWNSSATPREFLMEKMKICFTYFTLLSLPILIILGTYFYKSVDVLLLFFILINVYLATVILAKYASYPSEIDLPKGILVIMSLIFPPFLLGVIPFLYSKAINSLSLLLK